MIENVQYSQYSQYSQYFHGSLRKKNIYQELRTEADLEMIGNKRAKEVNSENIWCFRGS